MDSAKVVKTLLLFGLSSYVALRYFPTPLDAFGTSADGDFVPPNNEQLMRLLGAGLATVVLAPLL